jgi:TolA-binding protein
MDIDNIIQTLRQVSKKVQPSPYFKVTSKERLLQRIEAHSSLVRHPFWQKAVASVSLLALVFVFIFTLTTPNQTSAAYIGEATVLQGTMNLQHETEAKTVHSSSLIQVGDVLTLPAYSQVEIHFIDDSKSVLFSDTVIKIDSFLLNSTNIRNSLLAMTIRQGEIVSTVNKMDGDLSKLQIQTPSSIIEAKNSNFKVTVNQQGDTEVLPITNSVIVQALDGSKQTTTKVVAQAQAVQGYKIKISKRVSVSAPLQITSTDNSTPSTNQNSTTDNGNEPPVLALDNGIQTQIMGYLEIAQVKMYQAIDAINKGDFNTALSILKEYRQKLLAAYNLLTNTNTLDPVAGNNTITTILTNSLISMLIDSTQNLADTGFQSKILSILQPLDTLERTTKETIVMASVAILTPPSPSTTENIDSGTGTNGNSNENSSQAQGMIDATAALKTMNGKLAFDVNNLKNMVELQQTVSPEKQKDLEPLIAQTIDSIAGYINTIADWKLQQKETKNMVALFPNQTIYADTLQKIRNLISDRVSFIISNKLRLLK